MSVTPEQLQFLAADLPRDRVRRRKIGNEEIDYIDGFYAIERANEVFGFDGWTYEVRERRLALDYRKGADGRGNRVCVVEAVVRVTALGVTREDVGAGHGDGPPDSFNAQYDKAVKEAVTDGIKRALRSFGNSFGLALYDKRRRHVGVSEAAMPFAMELDALEPAAAQAWWQRTRPVLATLPGADRELIRTRFEAQLAEWRVLGELPPPQDAAPPAPVAACGTAAPPQPSPPQLPPGVSVPAAATDPVAPPELTPGEKLRAAMLADIAKAADGRALLQIAATLVEIGPELRAPLIAPYIARWAAVFATYADPATRRTAAKKLLEIDPRIRREGNWSPLAEYVPLDKMMPPPERGEDAKAVGP